MRENIYKFANDMQVRHFYAADKICPLFTDNKNIFFFIFIFPNPFKYFTQSDGIKSTTKAFITGNEQEADFVWIA